MATQTFPLTPEFTYAITAQAATLATRFEDGGVQLRAKWPRPRRMWRLSWKAASPTEAEELAAFYREMVGAAGEFYYAPSTKCERPYAAPTLGQVAGGALGARTRYAAFTWADASNETMVSFCEGSLAVGSGYLLTATVPIFPTSVTKAWVYVGATTAVLHKQATAITTSAGTWTEPEAGYAADGAAVPTANALAETVTAHFAEDSLVRNEDSAYHWSMSVVIEEVL
jgi:hypothetical protein